MEFTFFSFPRLSKERYIEIICILFSICILGLAILIGSWQYMFLASITYIFLLLIVHRLDLAVIFTILITPVTRFPGLRGYVEPIKLGIFVIILNIWFIKRYITDDKEKWKFVHDNPFNLFIISFLILSLISVVSSQDPKISIQALVPYVICFTYLYLFLDMFQKDKCIKKIIIAFLFTGCIVALVAVLQYIIIQFRVFTNLTRFVIPPVHQGILLTGKKQFALGGYRSVGTFYHPNLLGIYLSMILPLAFSLLFYIKNNMKRLLLVGIITAMITGIVCSGSRGAYFNLAFSLFILLTIFRKRIPKRLILAILVLLITMIPLYHGYLKSYLRLYEGLSYRDVIWRNALEMVSKHPFLGVGIGTFFKQYISEYGFTSVVDFEEIINEIETTGIPGGLVSFTAHNLYLNYAAEMGILAPILIVIFYIICIVLCLKYLLKNNNYSLNNIILIGTFAAIMGNFIHGFFEATTTFSYLPIGITFILIIALFITAIRQEIRNY